MKTTHLERDRKRLEHLGGMVAVEETWTIFCQTNDNVKGEPIDDDYLADLHKRIKSLRHSLDI